MHKIFFKKGGSHDPKIFERLALGTAVLTIIMTIMRLNIIKQKRDMRIRAGFKARFLLNEKSKKLGTALDLLLFDTLVIVSSTLPFAVCRKLPVEKRNAEQIRTYRKK